MTSEGLALVQQANMIAAVCGEEGLVFNGITEPFGELPAAADFTDLREGSPSYGAGITVPAPFDEAAIRKAVATKREAFAQARSWGGPPNFDSGADYANP
jgi:hypothetical protein